MKKMNTTSQLVVMALLVGIVLVASFLLVRSTLAQPNSSNQVQVTPTPEEEIYLVTGVIDGDTIDGVLFRDKEEYEALKKLESDPNPNPSIPPIANAEPVEVKLAGIDAYEYSGSEGHDIGDCAGQASLAGLTVMLSKGENYSDGWKEIRLARDPAQPDRDSIGRLIRYISLEDGTDINKRLILEGLALNWDGNHSRSAEFAEAEKTGQQTSRAKSIRSQCENNPRQPVDWQTGFRHEADLLSPGEKQFR